VNVLTNGSFDVGGNPMTSCKTGWFIFASAQLADFFTSPLVSYLLPNSMAFTSIGIGDIPNAISRRSLFCWGELPLLPHGKSFLEKARDFDAEVHMSMPLEPSS
jgi:hypothetical protein